MNNAIRVEVSAGELKCTELVIGKYQKHNTQSAMLEQTITKVSYYPSAKHSSNKSQNIFDAAEFGDSEQRYESTEKRIAFMDVPLGYTVEKVNAGLAALPNACLYRELSNQPLLTDNQENALANRITTMDEIAKSQLVVYPEDHVNAGQPILDSNRKLQYRKIYFWKTAKNDVDLRSREMEHYVPEFLEVVEETNNDEQFIIENQESTQSSQKV